MSSGFDLECRAVWGFDDGWFTVERSDWQRIAWESIEGDADDMLGLASALEAWSPFRAKRCAVEIDGDLFWLSSPKNSVGRGASFHRDMAADLAQSIRAELAKPRSTEEAAFDES